MGLFHALADIVYREYDRRVRRASLIKEYGESHHHDHADDIHADEANDTSDDMAEIANVRPGTPIAAATPAPAEPSGSHE